MTPFRITCVTCTARLAVRNEALIGQILACPKCGSMVLVERPAGDEGSAPHTETTRPSSAAPTAAPVVAAATGAGFDDVASALPTESALPVQPAAPSATPAPAPMPAPPIEATAGGTGSTLLWVGGSAVLGAVVVAGAMLLLTRGNDEPLAANVAAPPAPVIDDDALPSGSAPNQNAELPDAGDDAALPVDESLADDAAAADIQPDTGVPVVETPAGLPADPFAPDRAGDDAAADSSERPDEMADAPAPASEEAADPNQPRLVIEPSTRRRTIDPLDVDPEGLNLSSLLAGPPPATPSEAALEDVPTEEPADDAPPQPQPTEDELARSAVRRDPDGSPAGAPPDVAAALATHLPAVQIKQMPLCRFLDFATQLSGTPVSVSPQQLQLAAITAGRSVSVDLQDATLQQVLAEALKPLRLEPRADEAQIVLQRTGLPQRRTIDYPVDDLTTGDISAETIARWIESYVAPESWTAGGGDGTIAVGDGSLSIDAVEPVQYETLLLLEGIRKARGLTPKSRYPAKLVSDRSPYFALNERLTAPATFTFTAYTPLRAIFRHWQEETEVAVLVDWPALTEARLWPQTRVACSQHDVPWTSALDAVLQPLGLGWRAVDERTIEIISGAKLTSQPETHIYRKSDKVSGVPPQAVGGDVVLVRAPASVHRKLAAGR
ncbi:MAG: hypothetical protein KDA44_09970 [Planctomycetales bacterium]|nr:hypothetical protein [Planctomycetales bacterium]